MATDLLPDFIRSHYDVHEWRHACAILKTDFPDEWADLVDILSNFRLHRDAITARGKNKSPVSAWIDHEFHLRGWREKKFNTAIVVDGQASETPTHKVDCFRNRVGIEIEWNNKDPFYDRDLNNFRLLHELRSLSVGVIITRGDGLQNLFNELGKGRSYGRSTTHMSKLLPRINGGGAAGCPILAIGITERLYVR